ncbi:MAG: TIGR04282 family arsenosugar biosynthesis glycosyltransferase [Bdellovibrionales bacterium]|nr:TIGR04282 family arsenosugar biosynthesis glycosyltransferase [Bdellovibrionales bacterium]
MEKVKQGAVIIMAKIPFPGCAKTRLALGTGETLASDFALAFIKDLVRALSKAKNFQIYLSLDSSFLMDASYGKAKILFQGQGDLGQRMMNSIVQVQDRHEWIVLVGSDLPMLSIEMIDDAVVKLQDPSKFVIGPSQDGGFYLLGSTIWPKHLFAQMRWSHNQVFNQMTKKITRLGYDVEILEERYDIDTIEDLHQLKRDLLSGLFYLPDTQKLMERM